MKATRPKLVLLTGLAGLFVLAVCVFAVTAASRARAQDDSDRAERIQAIQRIIDEYGRGGIPRETTEVGEPVDDPASQRGALQPLRRVVAELDEMPSARHFREAGKHAHNALDE